MSNKISRLDDVYKFSLTIYDYLKNTEENELTALFENLVDDCFESQGTAIAAHRKAFQAVLDQTPDLPADLRKNLEDSLEILK